MAEAIVTDPTVTGNAPALPPFVFEGHNIRTVKDDFFPWFVAKDVCAALGLVWNSRTLGSIPKDWIGMAKLATPKVWDEKTSPPKRGGLRGDITIISEPAVYKLAFRSNKPEADRFTNWIASEVIPAIRRTGQYQVAQAPAPSDPPRLTTAKERNALTGLVNRYVGLLPGGPNQEAYKAAWRKLHDVLGIKAVEELTVEQLPRAVLFVQTLIEGVAVSAIPPKMPLKALPTNRAKVIDLNHLEIESRVSVLRSTADRLAFQVTDLAEGLMAPFNTVARDAKNYDHDLANMMNAINFGVQSMSIAMNGCVRGARNLADFAYSAMSAFRKLDAGLPPK